MGPSIADLLKRNENYAPTHSPMPLIKEIVAAGGGPPSTAIITCVDPRVFPEKLLSLGVGEAFVFRTVAGHPQAAMEDIAVLDINSHDGVKEIMVIYHTDCGAVQFDMPRIRSSWVERLPESKAGIDEKTFGSIDRDKVKLHLQNDVEWLKGQPLLNSKDKTISVHGYLYDIKTGKLDQLV